MPFTTAESLQSIIIDYIVVGGGTAGLALAARLTENSNMVVLVIEAGVYHGSVPEIDIPGYMGRTIANPTYDWTFLSTPQSRANDRVILQPRGKGLGGCSHNNFLGLFRPSKDEINAIQDLGNPGWNWDSFLHYMKKSEMMLPSDLSTPEAIRYAASPEQEFHGTEGPIKKSFPTHLGEMHFELFEAAENLGIKRNPESGNGFNAGSVTCFMSVDSDSATRSYSVSAYLEPNLSRNNLLILTESHVTKVMLKEEGSLLRAVGVEIHNNGNTTPVLVNREVILAAGSFQTPQILELSGIGNPEILRKYGIESLIDLPGVGENLQDHIGVSTIAEIETKDDTIDILQDPAEIEKHQKLYMQKGGLFANGPASSFVFVPGPSLGLEDITSFPQSIEYLANSNEALRPGLEKQYNIIKSLISDTNHAHAELLQFLGHQPLPYSTPEAGKKYTSLFCALLHPLSRGSVHIDSPNPLMPPVIDPRYFDNELDLEQLATIVDFTLKFYHTSPFSQHVKDIKIPRKEEREKGMDGLKEYIKQNCSTTFHPVGTASMLPRVDGGVVDSNLVVYGTKNLRVADASILPMELSSHTQAAVYAIAEKASDLLKVE